MSSICGVIRFDGKQVSIDRIDGMVARLAHIGSDRNGSWSYGQVGLGHVMQFNTPESCHDTQPRRDAASGLVITADVRLDHRDSLRVKLGLGLEWVELTDTELILRAYEKWSDRCAEYLHGDYALVIWDPRREMLFCARDHLGMKPFYYYYRRDGAFIFGTEIKAILHWDEVSHEKDEAAYARYVTAFRGDQRSTYYREIQRLPAAHCLTVSGVRLREQRYWTPDPNREVRLARDEDYVDSFGELLTRAVETRMRCHTRVGSMLSGGLDATSITALASRRISENHLKLAAFSWALEKGDPWPILDERAYIESFKRGTALEHHYIVNSGDLFAVDERIPVLHDSWCMDVNHRLRMDTFELARKAGVGAILWGNGGDELASSHGLNLMLELAVRGRWGDLIDELRIESRRQGLSIRRLFRREVLSPITDMITGRPYLFQQRQLEKVIGGRHSFGLSSEFARKNMSGGFFDRHLSDWPLASRKPVCANHLYSICSGSFAYGMESNLNLSTLFGIECRLPMLDVPLIEFCLGVPPEQHRHTGVGRRMIRRSMGKYLVPDIADRTDKSATVPDIHRKIVESIGLRNNLFQRWRTDPKIKSVLDVEKLQEGVSICAGVCTSGKFQRNSAIGPGPLIRAIMLGHYLERR